VAEITPNDGLGVVLATPLGLGPMGVAETTLKWVLGVAPWCPRGWLQVFFFSFFFLNIYMYMFFSKFFLKKKFN
jgi:hypothetical protein